MQALFETTRLYPESWISPGDIGAFYRGMMDVLFAENSVTQALGDMVVIAGVAGLVVLPLAWGAKLIFQRRCPA